MAFVVKFVIEYEMVAGVLLIEGVDCTYVNFDGFDPFKLNCSCSSQRKEANKIRKKQHKFQLLGRFSLANTRRRVLKKNLKTISSSAK
ncbi:unnamed protein product [Citrullus colocynthis]|uniref:Uncharacterized protein n=1 Tax=Citrullus colocynthis TaxID=252529 RepID=A0ABP0XLQ6_9ROSI